MTDLLQVTARPAAPSGHPLDPLSADEIATVRDVLRADRALRESTRFVSVELKEPAKEVVDGFTPGAPLRREAFVVLRDRADRTTYEAVVSLTDRAVVAWTSVDDGQPMITEEEFLGCEQLIKDDPRWQEAMRRRGFTDEQFPRAIVDKWASGYTMPEDHPSTRRIARPLTWMRGPEHEDNGYARPVEGLVVTVDLDTMEILEVLDHGVVPVPTKPGNWAPDLLTHPDNVGGHTAERAPMKPIRITQPEGPSFTLDGSAMSWGNWRLRIGFTPREGLVLHDIRYVDRGRERPVVHRASLSEMYVPYGDPAPTHWNKNIFDEGEYGLGVLANALELGCDCLGEILYLDAVVNDQDGNPKRLPNAICIHEEDAGIGWKHTDFRTGIGHVRRNRRLVLSFIATVGNYDYAFYWYLYLDGSIEFEVKLTGIISTGAVTPGEVPAHGTVVAPGLYGPHHQHFFNVRLHMRVDGDGNNVYEVESASLPPGPDNPHGSAWVQHKRQLTSEAQAQRLVDPLRARAWLVGNPHRRNAVRGEPSYKLEPGANVAPFFLDGSQQANRGGFATHHLWVTPYAERERYAAGEYVAQHPGGAGLPAYTAGDRSLVHEDLVVWYTMGAHHVVRPEDWPVMPVSRIGFHLKPVGFFDANPMLDLPPEPATCHGGDQAGGRCACC